MNRPEMKKTIWAIIQHKQEMLELHAKGKSNPQIKEIYDRTDAEITVFRSVYDALRNNDMMLKIYLPRAPIPELANKVTA